MDEVATIKENSGLPDWAKATVIGGIALILMALLVWSLNRSANKNYESLFAKSVDGLAASLQQTMLERKPDRAKQTLQRIVTAAGYSRVVLTDQSGNVFASAGATPIGSNISELAKSSPKTIVKSGESGLIGYCSIVLGTNNVIGGLMVQLQ